MWTNGRKKIHGLSLKDNVLWIYSYPGSINNSICSSYYFDALSGIRCILVTYIKGALTRAMGEEEATEDETQGLAKYQYFPLVVL